MQYFDKIIKPALELLYKNDMYLITHDVHEQSISHHLAKYIEGKLNKGDLSSFDVDCEFNKNIDSLKRVGGRTKYSDRPDIIVHKRGNNDDNRFVIEIKKEESECDKCKIRNIVKELNYEEGYALQEITHSSFGIYFYDGSNDCYKRYRVNRDDNGVITIEL